jgi:hypothetical protein
MIGTSRLRHVAGARLALACGHLRVAEVFFLHCSPKEHICLTRILSSSTPIPRFETDQKPVIRTIRRLRNTETEYYETRSSIPIPSRSPRIREMFDRIRKARKK